MEEDTSAAGGPSKFIKLIRCVSGGGCARVKGQGYRDQKPGHTHTATRTTSKKGTPSSLIHITRVNQSINQITNTTHTRTQRGGPRVHCGPEVRLRLQDHRRHARRCVIVWGGGGQRPAAGGA